MRKPSSEKMDTTTTKGAWSLQEDEILIDYIKKHGQGCWNSLPKAAGLRRCGKSCRLRWINYLRPDLKRGRFGEDEEDLIIRLHKLLGNRWSLIAGRLPGRTDNGVKNYWNSQIKKKLLKTATTTPLHPNKPHHQIINHNEPNNNLAKFFIDTSTVNDDEVDSSADSAIGLNLDLTLSIKCTSNAAMAGPQVVA